MNDQAPFARKPQNAAITYAQAAGFVYLIAMAIRGMRYRPIAAWTFIIAGGLAFWALDSWDMSSTRNAYSFFGLLAVAGIAMIRLIMASGSEYTDQTEQLVTDNHSRYISQDVKIAVANRDMGRCVQCGSNQDLQYDHVYPWSQGGLNTYTNLQLLCGYCNKSKGASY